MKSISIGIFGSIGSEKTGMLNTIQANQRCTLAQEKKKARMETSLYKKETSSELLEFADFSEHFECPFYHIDKLGLFDVVLLTVDVRTGCTEYISRVLEKRREDVIVCINKVDVLFGSRPESIYNACHTLVEALDKKASSKMFYLIASARYKISLFSGFVSDFSKKRFIDRLHTVYKILSISDMHKKDVKDVYWKSKYFDVIDKNTGIYKANPVLASVSDILVHAEGIPSLSHTIISAIKEIHQDKNSSGEGLIAVEGFSNNKTNFLVKNTSIENNRTIVHNKSTYRVIDILSSHRDGHIHTVQIEKEEELLQEIKSTNTHYISIVLSIIGEEECKMVKRLSSAYPGISLCPTQSTEKSGPSAEYKIEIFAVGPHTLEEFIADIHKNVDRQSIKTSRPLYHVRRTPKGSNAFTLSIRSVYIRIELLSAFDKDSRENGLKTEKKSSSDYLIYELDKNSHNYVHIKKDILDNGIESAEIYSTIKSAVQSIKTSNKVLSISHTVAVAELLHAPSSKKRTENDTDKSVEICFNRCQYSIIEPYIVLQVLLHTPAMCVPRSCEAFLNKLTQKRTTKSLTASIAKRCSGKVLHFTEDAFLLAAKLDIILPGSTHTEFLSLISTFFKSFLSYTIDIQYMPSPLKNSRSSDLPPELSLVQKSKENVFYSRV
ncbi:hypothetical protein NEMIN01_1932 [Nematocida minor]|uniref:uncharacterized protein n=1 Tax=Nematocida minor TaxID=1912983 RepID=UPI00221FDA7F|nr:uncharacterized protein NEMIN01_1932 [Nematocida minor]KAI5192303.1 hypothetical protein NEMIN01_1932 [Nematocida minor]